MEIALAFILGIGNFALHKAVMESGHPALQEMAWLATKRARRIAFITEFAMLLAAMLLIANGYPAMIFAYVLYSGLNMLGAWLILNKQR